MILPAFLMSGKKQFRRKEVASSDSDEGAPLKPRPPSGSAAIPGKGKAAAKTPTLSFGDEDAADEETISNSLGRIGDKRPKKKMKQAPPLAVPVVEVAPPIIGGD